MLPSLPPVFQTIFRTWSHVWSQRILDLHWTEEELHTYDELPITYQAQPQIQDSSHLPGTIANPTSFPKPTHHGEINASPDEALKGYLDLMSYDFEYSPLPPISPTESLNHLISYFESSEASSNTSRCSQKSDMSHSKQEQSNQLVTNNAPGLPIEEADPEKAVGATDSGSIQLEKILKILSRNKSKRISAGRFTFKRLEFNSEVFARNRLLTDPNEQEKRQALITLVNSSPNNRLFINGDDIYAADEIFQELYRKSKQKNLVLGKRGRGEKEVKPRGHLKREILRDSKQKFFHKLPQWLAFWAERTGGRTLEELLKVSRAGRRKSVGLYLFYVEMINEIIPPNKTNLDDHQSAELLIEALIIFENFE